MHGQQNINILKNGHVYGPVEEVIDIFESSQIVLRKNYLENVHVRFYKHNLKLTNEQVIGDLNRLFQIMHYVQLLHACF
jgi:hypothetical protein